MSDESSNIWHGAAIVLDHPTGLIEAVVREKEPVVESWLIDQCPRCGDILFPDGENETYWKYACTGCCHQVLVSQNVVDRPDHTAPTWFANGETLTINDRVFVRGCPACGQTLSHTGDRTTPPVLYDGWWCGSCRHETLISKAPIPDQPDTPPIRVARDPEGEPV